MNNGTKHAGVVVPMMTPITASGQLDEPAVGRLVDFLLAGGVDGIFVLGTTGEGAAVPREFRKRMVECAVARAARRARVYAGIGDSYPDDVAVGNEYFHAGADAVVARPPMSFPEAKLLSWFRSLLDGLEGPLLIYNMPSTTKVSIPLEVVAELIGHPGLSGMKDSENSPKRLEELLRRFGGRPEFSIFVGVGRLMAKGLRLGAEGIVPSVGNLIPEVCQGLCACAARGDWDAAQQHAARMDSVAALYQEGRNLGQSLAALKAALSCRGLCGPHMLPPLNTLGVDELEKVRGKMARLNLL